MYASPSYGSPSVASRYVSAPSTFTETLVPAAPTTVTEMIAEPSYARTVSQPRYMPMQPMMVQSQPNLANLAAGEVGLQVEVQQLAAALAQERQARQSLEAKVAGIMSTLAAYKARLDRIDPPDTPLKQATRMVEQRGNINVNHVTGHVTLLKPLRFEPRTTKDRPTAVFVDIDQAEAICKDLAELSNIFNCPMTIEGHTKGGETQYWQNLADNRATIVTQLMIDFGANPDLLRAVGRPGRLGKNEVRTEIFMDISNIKDEDAAVQEVDIIQNGRVVERDLYQAGHLVERDQGRTSMTEVRDVVASNGMVLERDFKVQNVQERNIIGLGGRTVERQRSDSALVQPVVTSPMSMSRPLVRQAGYGYM